MDEGALADGLPLPLTGATRLCAILGDPIAQAGSPRLFNAAFRARAMATVLVPAQVPAHRLNTVLAGLSGIGNLDGLVITAPHKLALAGHVDALGPQARRTGVVNAVRCTAEGEWIGENFDGAGCVAALRRRGHDPAGRSAAVIGAGGAGISVAHALAQAGVTALAVRDPDEPRREALLQALGREYPGLARAAASTSSGHADLLVNCSPLGSNPADPLPCERGELQHASVVVDLAFGTQPTPLLRAAADAGSAAVSAYDVLAGQVDEIIDFIYGRVR